jgi:hypothetical protein
MSRMYGPDGGRLSAGRATNLAHWSGDLATLATAAATNQSTADVLASPVMLGRLGGGPANAALLGGAAAARYGRRYGAALPSLSAPYHDNATRFDGTDNVVLGGYSQLALRLAAVLTGPGRQVSLRLATPVAGILHGDSNATVFTAGGEALAAQYVVCTAPLGVLRGGGLALEPALPEQTAAAAARLGVGRLEKLWLEFDTVSAAVWLCVWLGGWRGGGGGGGVGVEGWGPGPVAGQRPFQH